MARYRVPTQAFRNFLSILLGFILGAVNNLVVLPWAFADDLGEWGLVRLVMAWASLIAPIILFGAPSAMNRYIGKMGRAQKVPKLLGTLMWPPLVLFSGFVALPALVFPEGVSHMLSLSVSQSKAVQPIAILSAIITAQLFLASFLSTQLKTTLATFAQETVFKLGYTCLALSLGLGWLGKSAFLPAYLVLNVLVLLILVAQSLANQFKVDLRGLGKSEIRKEIRQYSSALVMGSGAWVILNQLDIIMVGSLLGLDRVPVFTVAAFVATVTTLPNRASQRLFQPLISRALDIDDPVEIDRLIQLSHRLLLLSSGWILTCIWVATPQIDHMLQPEFRGISWLILTLGLAKVMRSSASGSSVLLAQSNHFKKMVAINWSMVILAIPLNLFFIPESGLGMGLTGAALATLISIGISTTGRQILLWTIWKRVVLSKKTVIICMVLLLPAVILVQWNPEWPHLVTLLTKSAIVTGWTALAAVKLNLAPEGVQFVAQKAPWLSKWL